MASTMCSLMWEARKRQAWESTDGKITQKEEIASLIQFNCSFFFLLLL